MMHIFKPHPPERKQNTKTRRKKQKSLKISNYLTKKKKKNNPKTLPLSCKFIVNNLHKFLPQTAFFCRDYYTTGNKTLTKKAVIPVYMIWSVQRSLQINA